MDFEDSPEEAKFRAEVRDWLEANAKPRTTREAVDILEENGAAGSMAASRAWQKKKAQAGYARITCNRSFLARRSRSTAWRAGVPSRSGWACAFRP
jgi:alkylation response protein AidB-like acyl-CoA dehydrogenase